MSVPAANVLDDLSGAYKARKLTNEANDAADELLHRVQNGEPAPEGEQKPKPSLISRELSAVKDAGKDIGMGIIETPRAIVKGARDAVANTLSIADELNDWIKPKLKDTPLEFLNSGVTFENGHFRLFGPEEGTAMKEARLGDMVPNLNAPESVTGGLVKNISQFVVGLKGVNKAFSAAGVPAATGTAGYVMTSLKGALTNAVAFDPHQDRLSNLIEKFPVLQNPVTEYLASTPDDGAAEGRFKNAIEGLGVGLLADGFIKSVRLVKNAVQAKTAVNAAMIDVAPQELSEEVGKLLDSKPPAPGELAKPPPLIVKPNKGAAEKLSAAVTRTAPIAADDVVGRMAAQLDSVPSSAAGRAMETPKTFINFARIDTPEDVKRVMQGVSDIVAPVKDTAKAGVRTFKQIKLDAAHEDAWGALVARQVGQPLSDSQMVGARQLWATATDKLAQLAQEAATSPSEANLFAFRKMLATHNMIQNEVLGARAAIARAQASMRIPVGSSAERLKEIQFSLEQHGGSDVARELAGAIDKMAKAGMISEMASAAEKGALAKTVDAAKEAWTLGLLTSPKTHLRNILSNSLFAPVQLVERKAASQFASLFGDQTSVHPGEVAAQYEGLTTGTKDMLRYYGKMIKTRILEGEDAAAQVPNPVAETGIPGATKLDLPGRAISSQAFNLDANGWLGRGADAVGSAYGITYNALTAEDNFFKVLGYRMETYAQAHRQAAQEALSGAIANDKESIASRMADLVVNPPENIRMAAVDQALYQTFNEAPGWFGQMLLKAKRQSLVAHVLIPFARTTTNLQRAAFERSPLAPLVGQWRADLAAGGARRDLALARWSLGSMVTLAMVDSTMKGQITGRGPVEPSQREAMSREGWRPYSLKIGDRWYSYNGLSPIGDQMGMAADLAELAMHGHEQLADGKEMENVTLATVAAIAGNVMNKSYLSGFSDAVDALHDPNGGAAKWARSMAGSVVPSGVAAIGKAIDPNVREVNSMMDAIRARMPGLSDSLPARHDLWGKEMRADSGYGKVFDAFSPIFTQKPSDEPIDSEIIKHQMDVKMPPRVTSFNGISVDMHRFPAAYERYVELAGNALKSPAWGTGAKDLLNAVVTDKHPLSTVYRLRSDGPEGGKDVFVRDIIRQYREDARRQILKEFPELAAEVGQKQEKQRALKMPVLN